MIEREVPFGRIPPQSLEAEQAVLGSMLIERAAIDKAIEIVKPQDYYKEAHRAIHEAILMLYDRDDPVDILTLPEQLRSMDLLDRIGGVTYLFQLQNAVPSAASVEYYARLVASKALRRKIIDSANQQAAAAYDDETDDETLIGNCGQIFQEAIARQSPGQYRTMAQIVAETFEIIEAASENPGGITGVSAGIEDLDFATAGWQPGEVILVAARPGVGKTAISVNTFGMSAVKAGRKPVIFSLEMTRTQLVSRMIANNCRVSGTLLRNGSLNDALWRKVGEECSRLSELPIHIDDTSSATTAHIRARLREVARREFIPDIAIIDYLALVGGREKGIPEHIRIDQVASQLKHIAKEFNIPVILLTQLNREIERSGERAPMQSDLKEGGEAHADIVLALWPAKNGIRQDDDGNEIKKIWLTIVKNRNGQDQRDIPLCYHAAWTRFDQMSDNEDERVFGGQPPAEKSGSQRHNHNKATKNSTLPTRPTAYKDNDEDLPASGNSAFDMVPGWKP